jgi:hypothetical protein
MQRQAKCGNDWIDVAADGLGAENTDEHGWRFAPHGWKVMRRAWIGAGGSDRSRDPLKRPFIRAARSAIRAYPC